MNMNNVIALDAPVSAAKKTRKAVKKSSSRSIASRTTVPVNKLGVIDQCVVAFERRNLLATLFGFWLGGIVPLAVYMTAHYSVQANPYLWVLVVAGLVYSATTVYKWGVIAFSSPVKAVGFVALLEGVLTFSPEHVLSLAALATLMAINAIATACNLIAQRKEARKEAK